MLLCTLIHFAFQMLRNCKVARVLPRIADCAKNDRNAVLRARYLQQLHVKETARCCYFLDH